MMCSKKSAFGAAVRLQPSCCSVITATEGNGHVVEPKDGEEATLCEEARCELVDYHALPGYLKDNEFILRYYRAEWPLKQALLSTFSVHNETINVWTHLAGFLIFLVLTVHTVVVSPKSMVVTPGDEVTGSGSALYKAKMEVAACLRSLRELGDELKSSSSSSEDEAPPSSSSPSSVDYPDGELLVGCSPGKLLSPINFTNTNVLRRREKKDEARTRDPPPVEPLTRWPFFAFLSGAMFCLLTSSACHLIYCHSEHMANVMLRLDYVGIAALIVSSFYPVVFYSFMCRPFLCNLYMGFITAFGALTVSVSLVPVFQTAEFRPVRAGVFFCMGFSGLVPILHKLVAFGHRPEAIHSAGYELLMGASYGLGVVVYVTRIPERWTPGKFDIVGHSHQLFHVLVIAGAYAHYLAGLVYLQWRSIDRC